MPWRVTSAPRWADTDPGLRPTPGANPLDLRATDRLAVRMRMLVLGGTAWLGRTVAAEAVRRGHDVTCLARGSAEPPAGATFISADRDLEDGLAPVAGEEWDAVVDVTRQPGHARRAVRDLVAAHRVLVSTGNVYARFDRLEQDEDSPLRPPLDGDVMTSMEVYGEAKVACEKAVRAADGPAAIVRSGLIGGPGDWSGRTGYWPWRFAHPVGERVVVPDDLDFPCAVIDVRDLAAWLVTASEQRLHGTFNATGPTTRCTTCWPPRQAWPAPRQPPCPSIATAWPSSASGRGWARRHCPCGSTTRSGAGSPPWRRRGAAPPA